MLLSDQRRELWDRQLIAEGHALVRECLRRNTPGPYQVQAAINAVHADAPSVDKTDWRQVVALYDQLLVLTPTDLVRLNRAVAVAEVDGPASGLRLVDALELRDESAWHIARADLLRRLGRTSDAAASYDVAIELTENAAERDFLMRRRGALPRVG